MLKVFVVLMGIIFPLALSASNSRIIGGQEVKDASEFPWMADLSILYRNNRWYHLCGGAIIHYKWIITAAHCAQYVARK